MMTTDPEKTPAERNAEIITEAVMNMAKAAEHLGVQMGEAAVRLMHGVEESSQALAAALLKDLERTDDHN